MGNFEEYLNKLHCGQTSFYELAKASFDDSSKASELNKENEDYLADNMELRSQIDQAEKLWRRQQKEIAGLKAQVDALMFEFCPEDMTEPQIEEYEAYQKAAQLKRGE